MTKILVLICFFLKAFVSGDNQINVVQDWIKLTLSSCENKDVACDLVNFYEAQLFRINSSSEGTTSAWFIVSDGVQGAFYYESYNEGNEDVEGVYVYPDWFSCVSGTWRRHVLIKGRYCNISSAVVLNNTLRIGTSMITDSPVISYSPPSYADFGAAENVMDPFENKTVEVRESLIEGAGQGLFTTRTIKEGWFVCFYGGLLLHKDFVISPTERRSLSVFEQMKSRR